MGQKYKELRITKRELMIKSLLYRFWTVIFEVVLASILMYVDITNLYVYIVLVNTIKVVAYFGYDLGWFSFVHRPGVLKIFKRWFRVDDQTS